jgi:hypothetical protein
MVRLKTSARTVIIIYSHPPPPPHPPLAAVLQEPVGMPTKTIEILTAEKTPQIVKPCNLTAFGHL